MDKNRNQYKELAEKCFEYRQGFGGGSCFLKKEDIRYQLYKLFSILHLSFARAYELNYFEDLIALFTLRIELRDLLASKEYQSYKERHLDATMQKITKLLAEECVV